MMTITVLLPELRMSDHLLFNFRFITFEYDFWLVDFMLSFKSNRDLY